MGIFNARSFDSKQEKCKRHDSGNIEYYCCDHDSVICVVSYHPKRKSKLMSDVAKKYEESSEFKALISKIQKLEA